MDQLLKLLREFRDRRDWAKFHTPKDLAVSISVEAGELLELFQWRASELDLDQRERAKIASEAADVFLYTLLLFDRLNLNPVEQAIAKLNFNEERFPVSETYGIPGSKLASK